MTKKNSQVRQAIKEFERFRKTNDISTYRLARITDMAQATVWRFMSGENAKVSSEFLARLQEQGLIK